jgi:hypothetical protein
MILPGLRKNESTTVTQTAEALIVAVGANPGLLQRNLQPRQNLADDDLAPQNTSIREKHEFAGLDVVSDSTSWELLIFGVGYRATPYQFCPVFNMAALVNCEVAVTTSLGERC